MNEPALVSKVWNYAHVLRDEGVSSIGRNDARHAAARGLHVTAGDIMGAASEPSRLKVRQHRARLRAQGLRPIQIWVPDVRASAFRAQAHRQSLAVAMSGHARDDQAFIDAISEWADSGGAED